MTKHCSLIRARFRFLSQATPPIQSVIQVNSDLNCLSYRAALKAAPQPAGAPVATKVEKTATVATKKAATPKKAASAKKAKPAAGKSVS